MHRRTLRHPSYCRRAFFYVSLERVAADWSSYDHLAESRFRRLETNSDVPAGPAWESRRCRLEPHHRPSFHGRGGEIALTREGRAPGPAMTDLDLFTDLDLTRPGLEPVAAALAKKDEAAAKHALADCYRHRTVPRYYISVGEKANPKPAAPDVARAGRALRHEFESIRYPHAFGPVID